MRFKHSNSNRNINFKKKRLTFSAILNSEYLFHRSTQIQMALNHERMLSKDFHIKRAKSKIDIGKKGKTLNSKDNNESNLNSSQELNNTSIKKDIPLELYFLLLEYEKLFMKENNKFYNIKEYNDAVLSFWHLIKQTNKKKERALLLKKYFPDVDKNIINLYSDHIQKLSFNLFKSNPLLSYNNFYEIFFHYLSEFNLYHKNENKINNIKIKIVKFLEKLKDFLEYVEILQDSDFDSISRDIKLKNSKFIKEFGGKIKNEIIKLKEKTYKQNVKDIKDSTIMINKTKNTLSNLNENKNLFEDPINFNIKYNTMNINKSKSYSKININNFRTPISPISPFSNSLSKIRFFSPKKTGRISNTISTDFYLSDKKSILKKQKKQSSKNINDENLNKIFNNNLRYSKLKNSYIIDKRRNSSSVIDLEMKNRFISIINNKRSSYRKKANTNDKKVDFDILSGRNSLHSSENEKEKKYINKNQSSSSKLLKIQKKNKISLFSSFNTNLSSKNHNILKKNNLLLQRTNNDLDISIANKKRLFNMKKVFDYDKYKEPLLLLYDNIKKTPQIKKIDIDNIKKYFIQKKKNFNLNFNSMDIIKQAKNITQKLDIEKKTKRIFQPYLSYKQIQKLDNITKLNNKVYALDINYMNHIFDFKSKNSESIQANLG